MKRIFTLIVLTCAFVTSFGQASCPQIESGSFNVTQAGTGCYQFTLNYYNPTGDANKSLKITYSINGGALQSSPCLTAPKKQGNNYVYTNFTSNIVCGTLATLTITVTSYTTDNCSNGGICKMYQSIGGGGFLEIPATILPVEMKSFSATRANNKVSLKWITSSENNNRGFNVQRNTKGAWETIAFMFSAAEFGNSTSELAYSYADANTNTGVSQYRVQQVDIDGKATYSEVRSVRGEQMSSRLVVYPNPSSTGKVQVVMEDQAAKIIEVADMNGRIVRKMDNVKNNAMIDRLENGIYSIRVIDMVSGAVSMEKVMIKK